MTNFAAMMVCSMLLVLAAATSMLVFMFFHLHLPLFALCINYWLICVVSLLGRLCAYKQSMWLSWQGLVLHQHHRLLLVADWSVLNNTHLHHLQVRACATKTPRFSPGCQHLSFIESYVPVLYPVIYVYIPWRCMGIRIEKTFSLAG